MKEVRELSWKKDYQAKHRKKENQQDANGFKRKNQKNTEAADVSCQGSL